MFFPKEMSGALRWLVRRKIPNTQNKRPWSPLKKKPEGYKPKSSEEGKDRWRYAWNQQAICTDYAFARDYAASHEKALDGLSFVIHPFGQDDEQERIVCVDVDRAFGPDKKPWPEVQTLLDALAGSCFVEYSRSGKGLHIFFKTTCTAFKNLYQRKLNEHCAVDCLCSSQIAVTGKVYEDYKTLAAVPFEFLESQDFFTYERVEREFADCDFITEWWHQEDNGLDEEERADLIEEMQNWTPAIKDHGRSNTMFAAACQLLRRGVIGWEALHLLEYVPCEPEMEQSDLIHKIEDAYVKTVNDGTFCGGTPEFDVVPTDEDDSLEDEKVEDAPDGPGKRYGGKAHVLSLAQLDEWEVSLEWLIKGVCVSQINQALVIGGRAKSFKTAIMADLFLSVCTGEPFLGEFEVVTQKSCMFFTAEIGMPAARQLFARVRDAKKIAPGVVDNLFISDWLPSFSSEPDLTTLEKILRDVKPGVVGFDPWYFGAAGSEVGDMFATGKLLRKLTKLVTDCGAMPVIAHHANRRKADSNEPMGLDELSGAGFDAFFRQWILLSHAEEFKDGIAHLWANIGGSAFGSGGQWRLTIDEGRPDAESFDRKWDVEISQMTNEAYDQETQDRVLSFLRQNQDGIGKRDLGDMLDIDKDKLQKIVRRLYDKQLVTLQNGKVVPLGDDLTE